MHIRKSDGFTVIEVLLFLAITGLMFATMIVSVTTALNNQRYNDSVRSLQSKVQEQYAALLSIENDGTEDRCSGAVRGRGDCFIVGRLMTFGGDSSVAIRQLAVRYGSEIPLASDEITVLAGEGMQYIDLGAVDDYSLEWGSEVKKPEGNRTQAARPNDSLSILLVRSPFSGSIYTFSGNAITSSSPSNENIKSLINNENYNKNTALCVSYWGIGGGDDRYVYIKKNASAASYIETHTDASVDSTGVMCNG